MKIIIYLHILILLSCEGKTPQGAGTTPPTHDGGNEALNGGTPPVSSATANSKTKSTQELSDKQQGIDKQQRTDQQEEKQEEAEEAPPLQVKTASESTSSNEDIGEDCYSLAGNINDSSLEYVRQNQPNRNITHLSIEEYKLDAYSSLDQSQKEMIDKIDISKGAPGSSPGSFHIKMKDIPINTLEIHLFWLPMNSSKPFSIISTFSIDDEFQTIHSYDFEGLPLLKVKFKTMDAVDLVKYIDLNN